MPTMAWRDWNRLISVLDGSSGTAPTQYLLIRGRASALPRARLRHHSRCGGGPTSPPKKREEALRPPLVYTNAAGNLSAYLRRRHTMTAGGINSHNSEAPEPGCEMLHELLSVPPGSALVWVTVGTGVLVTVGGFVAVGVTVGG
jgi:hypothetical protein